MRIKISRSWSKLMIESDVEAHIINELTRGTDDSGGALEDTNANVERMALAFARLANVLLDKRVLTLGEVNEMIGERYNVTEVI